MTKYELRELTIKNHSIIDPFLGLHNAYDVMYYQSTQLEKDYEFWGSFDVKERLQAILNLAPTQFRALWNSKESLLPMIELVRNRYSQVSTSSQAHQLEPLLTFFTPEEITFNQRGTACTLKHDDFTMYYSPAVRKANSDDIEKILWLFPEDPGLERSRLTASLSHCTVFVIVLDEKIVSIARTDVETPNAAHIVGVATHPSFTGKGYATYCVSALCEDIFTRCENIFLAYADGNDAAGRVYEKLGFISLSEKRMRARFSFADSR